MPRCIVVCAGEYGSVDFHLEKDDYVICCDGGLSAAGKMGIKADLLMGDLDSLEGPIPNGLEVLRFPAKKDDTDSMLAIKEGLRLGFSDFLLLFSLGGRLDHTIANIQTLMFLKERGATARLIGPNDDIQILTEGSSLRLNRKKGYTLSVFAYGGGAKGVCLTGVEYPLKDAVLENAFPLGVGNHIVETTADISVKEGNLLIIQSKIKS